MSGRARPLGVWAGALAWLFAAAPLIAQPAPAPQATTPAPIARSVGVTDDAEIQGRLRSIFGQIPALRGTTVQVSAGVVTLTGSVPAAADIARAQTIASRVAGVVTVENRLQRDLAVDSNLTPILANVKNDVRGIGRALPLVGIAVAIALVIGFLGYLLAGRARIWRAITPNAFLAELVASSIRFVFVLIGIVAGLEVLGATALLGAVLGGAGVVGIALGFALRDTIDNYVSSVMLSLRQPFRANDHVVIEGSEGRVVRLTSRATILITLDGNHLRIPNSTVFKAVILNYTRNPERRFSFDLGVDADDDPLKAMAVGLEAINAQSYVLECPRASAVIQEVGDSNILLRFFGWVDQTHTDFLKGRSLAIQAAKYALEGSGFALPEPIYRLRFDEGAKLSVNAVAGEQPRNSDKPAVDSQVLTTRAAAATSTKADTAPEDNVEQIVRDERADGSTQDLLDDRRPIE